MLLAFGRVDNFRGFKFFLVAIVIFDGRDLLVVSDMEVIVKVAPEGGIPGEVPALFRFVILANKK